VDRFLLRQTAAPGALRVLAIQVQFADSLMGGQPGSARLAVHDSTFFANELKHVEQYYRGASRGLLSIQWRVTPRLYNLPERMGYYGDDALEETRGVELMQSVIDSADADEDFSQFDALMVIHAGAGQETDVLDNSRRQLYSTFYDRTDIDAAFEDSTVLGLLTNDSIGGEPFLVDNFMIVPEDASQDDITIGTLGVWAFEIGSRLGLVPLFDSTPSGFPDSHGVGEFDLMSYGLFNAQGFVPGFPGAFNRVLAGWIDPLEIDAGGSFRLHDINRVALGDTACLKIPITESEYYLVVNRVHDANFDSLFTFADFDSDLVPDNTDSLEGAEFDFFLTDFTNPYVVKPDPNMGGLLRRFVNTGSGIYVWHVDETVIRQNLEADFLPNDFSSRKGVDLEEADGIQDMDQTSGPFAFGSHFDSFRAGNNTTFGPATQPGSASNSGAPSGTTIRDVSAPDSFMTLNVDISLPYTDTRRRWDAMVASQPVTAFNLDAAGDDELVVLADTGAVYAFTGDGAEFLDRDGDAATIQPYFSAPGAVWVGAPAFGDIDGGGDAEIVATSRDGRVYAWKGDSTEVFDGDADPLTRGVLHEGPPIAAPPMLVDVNDDSVNEVVVVESAGDSLVIRFIDGAGTDVLPSDPQLQSEWPVRIQAQSCAPLGYGALGLPGRETEGVVVAWADTVRGVYGVSYHPVRILSGTHWDVLSQTFGAKGEIGAAFPSMSPPAVADLDRDGVEEAVVTVPDGRVVLFAPGDIMYDGSLSSSATPPSAPMLVVAVDLRSSHPSAPALGDIDGNGTLEIAVYDDGFFYVFEHNLRLRLNWPQPMRANELGSVPPLALGSVLTGPLIADIDGGGDAEVVFPSLDGTLYAFDGDGNALSGFPRTGPAGPGATPTLGDLDGDGEMALISLGAAGSLVGIEAVDDSVVVENRAVLSIQSLSGSTTQESFWSMYQHDPARLGRVTEANPIQTSSRITEPNSFIIYPNPVRGDAVHARIVLNQTATVNVDIFNLEGERAISRQFTRYNTGSTVQAPFDEAISVENLTSGVYLLKVSVSGPGGSESFVKTFAVLK
jgi:M6 family metalloprotease-like protein